MADHLSDQTFVIPTQRLELLVVKIESLPEPLGGIFQFPFLERLRLANIRNSKTGKEGVQITTESSHTRQTDSFKERSLSSSRAKILSNEDLSLSALSSVVKTC